MSKGMLMALDLGLPLRPPRPPRWEVGGDGVAADEGPVNSDV